MLLEHQTATTQQKEDQQEEANGHQGAGPRRESPFPVTRLFRRPSLDTWPAVGSVVTAGRREVADHGGDIPSQPDHTTDNLTYKQVEFSTE